MSTVPSFYGFMRFLCDDSMSLQLDVLLPFFSVGFSYLFILSYSGLFVFNFPIILYYVVIILDACLYSEIGKKA